MAGLDGGHGVLGLAGEADHVGLAELVCRAVPGSEVTPLEVLAFGQRSSGRAAHSSGQGEAPVDLGLCVKGT